MIQMKKILFTILILLTSNFVKSQENLMLPAFSTGSFNNYITKGTGDGGNLLTYNTFFRFHTGFAIGSPYTKKIGGGYEEKATIAFNARSGEILAKGSIITENNIAAKNHMLIGFGKYLGATGATYSKIIECGWNETVKDHTNFYVSGNSPSDNEIKMTIIQNGNVGIGTTNPGSYKLAVEGKIGAHEIVVTTDGWSDFVFENDYKLKDLSLP